MRRREFLQLPAAAAAASLAASATSTAAATTTAAWRPRDGIRQPNVVVIVLDDIGFSDLGCYGSELHTPAIDGLADQGVRFQNFHVTALCAPTRACLLTGRNAHSVGVGNIAEWGRDHPAYRGWIRQDAATLAERLKPAGYTTLATGKWHLSALDDQNGSGPYTHWPVGRGFDRWYGFHGNAMDHWHPEMFENTVAAYPDKTDDYHLSADLVSRSIHYVKDHLAATPEKPFFLYLAFGACHFPLHAPADDIRRHQGRYAKGWDAVRDERFAAQRAMGVVPEHALLAPRNPGLPAWQDLSSDQRRIAERGQEVYAAFLEHTDAQVQRFVDFLKSEQEFDDTICIVMSDNGAAPGGGGLEAIMDVRRISYYERETRRELLENIEALGTDRSYGMYGSGWSQASNTPLKWYKGDTYGGGTRSPLVVSWPAAGLPQGQINEQYTHAIDIVPSVLELLNMPAESSIDDKPVLPLHGVSFAHTFDHHDAPTKKEVQYFETSGDRAVWADGWKAVARHQAGEPFEDDVWELYRTSTDFSEIDNLADTHPDRLQSLINLWHEKAHEDQVLPMDDDLQRLYQEAVPPQRPRYVFFPGMTRLDRLSAPDIFSYPSRVLADLEFTDGTANGVILASGDSGAGYELFVQDGYLHFYYVYTRSEHVSLRSTRPIGSGSRTVGLKVEPTGDSSAAITMLDGDNVIGELALPKLWQLYAPNSGLRCGENRHAPISRAYEPPFVIGDGLTRVVVTLDLDAAGASRQA
ncbi:MAG: arylsulfatase [Pseudomonadota bacterium]